jgi:hypothetical protein
LTVRASKNPKNINFIPHPINTLHDLSSSHSHTNSFPLS